ncbi:MAG: hypothetical protein ACP5FY_06680, partial [Kosmotogaceae bacterium]
GRVRDLGRTTKDGSSQRSADLGTKNRFSLSNEGFLSLPTATHSCYLRLFKTRSRFQTGMTALGRLSVGTALLNNDQQSFITA